jgi:hypothetical protein
VNNVGATDNQGERVRENSLVNIVDSVSIDVERVIFIGVRMSKAPLTLTPMDYDFSLALVILA